MFTRLFDLNKILMALFLVVLFAIGAAATARFGASSQTEAPAEQSTGIELPAGLTEAQQELEAPELNDTKALLTVILGGVVAGSVIGMGATLAAVFWVLNKLLKGSPIRS